MERDLKRQADLECLDQSITRVVYADKTEQEPETDDEVIVSDVLLLHQMSFELQVEVARPNEAQHRTRKTADEAHQNRKVRNETSH